MEEVFYQEAIRYITGEMGPDEAQRFEDQNLVDEARAKEYALFKQVWHEVESYGVKADEPSIEKNWVRFSERAFDEDKAKIVSVSWWKQLTRIAAVVLVVVGSVIAWSVMTKDSFDTNPVVVSTSEDSKVLDLPDGSTVWLNHRSKITYDEKFVERIVRLEGEAFFDVQHFDANNKFRVETRSTLTTVLGTRFNVRDRLKDEQAAVFVEKGKVSFGPTREKDFANAILLTAGTAANYSKAKDEVLRIEEGNVNDIAWKTGVLDFDDSSLAEIMSELEKYYGVSFTWEHPEVLSCTFRTSFDLKEVGLAEVLEELGFGLELEFEIVEPTTVQVKGVGCLDNN